MMKKWMVCFIVAILLIGVVSAYARDLELSGTTDSYAVVIKIDRNPPVKGTNRITVDIRDTAGKTVTDATVMILYGMPPMPGMGAMNYRRAAQQKGQSYQAALNFSMSGPWYLDVRITREGASETVKFNVDVR